MDVLRLLCWCQNVRPDDLSSISTETERENLITLGLIKRHQRSDTLLLTNSGRAFLQAALATKGNCLALENIVTQSK